MIRFLAIKRGKFYISDLGLHHIYVIDSRTGLLLLVILAKLFSSSFTMLFVRKWASWVVKQDVLITLLDWLSMVRATCWWLTARTTEYPSFLQRWQFH